MNSHGKVTIFLTFKYIRPPFCFFWCSVTTMWRVNGYDLIIPFLWSASISGSIFHRKLGVGAVAVMATCHERGHKSTKRECGTQRLHHCFDLPWHGISSICSVVKNNKNLRGIRLSRASGHEEWKMKQQSTTNALLISLPDCTSTRSTCVEATTSTVDRITGVHQLMDVTKTGISNVWFNYNFKVI